VGEPRATADGRGRRHAERIIFYRQALMSNATTRAAVAAAPPAPTQRPAPDTGSVAAPPNVASSPKKGPPSALFRQPPQAPSSAASSATEAPTTAGGLASISTAKIGSTVTVRVIVQQAMPLKIVETAFFTGAIGNVVIGDKTKSKAFIIGFGDAATNKLGPQHLKSGQAYEIRGARVTTSKISKVNELQVGPDTDFVAMPSSLLDLPLVSSFQDSKSKSGLVQLRLTAKSVRGSPIYSSCFACKRKCSQDGTCSNSSCGSDCWRFRYALNTVVCDEAGTEQAITLFEAAARDFLGLDLDQVADENLPDELEKAVLALPGTSAVFIIAPAATSDGKDSILAVESVKRSGCIESPALIVEDDIEPTDEPNKELDFENEGKIQHAVFIKQEPTYDMYESDEDSYSIKRSKLSKMKTGSKRKF